MDVITATRTRACPETMTFGWVVFFMSMERAAENRARTEPTIKVLWKMWR